MPANKKKSRDLPPLPAAVFAEREYLIAAWSRCIEREVVESLNVVSFSLWNEAPEDIVPNMVRMRWKNDKRVGRDVVVPKSLVQRTQLFNWTIGEYPRADLDGEDSIRLFGPLTTGPIEVKADKVRTKRVRGLDTNYQVKPQRRRRRERRG